MGGKHGAAGLDRGTPFDFAVSLFLLTVDADAEIKMESTSAFWDKCLASAIHALGCIVFYYVIN